VTRSAGAAAAARNALAVNDVHSGLNRTEVADVVVPRSLPDIRAAVKRAAATRIPMSIAGGRHSMGGQQFCSGGVLLDTRALDCVLAFDRVAGTVEVEAGIQWPALLAFLERAQRGSRRRWAIAQKQTGADRLSLGGALASNVHGRGLAMRPIVAEVEAFTLVAADGRVRRCSRDQNADLFRLAVGGYGLFGVVHSVTLRLVPRRKLERVVELRTIDGLADAFGDRVRDGFLYGDFQFAIDPNGPGFLHRGVFSCYRPLDDDAAMPRGQQALSRQDWQRLISLAHTDKTRAFELYAAHYVATSGQRYYSDAHQSAEYLDGYHAALDVALGARARGSEMITELYVPRDRLVAFMGQAADDFRRTGVDVVYGTVRLIERDDETFLAWARQPYACVIFNLHTEHTLEGIAHTRAAMRRLIDLAVAQGGSFYLTYHRWARRDQVEACYPQFREFLAEKRRRDPDELFQSDWYRHYRDAFAA
jgi:FAD/FMN-containing dehydrogenase